MKKTIIGSILLMAVLTGCNKALDVAPENSLTFKNALETERDLEAALAAVGQYVLRIASENVNLQPAKGEYADETVVEYPDRVLSPEYIPEGWWMMHYFVIAQANVVFHFVDDIRMTEERRNIYKGQANFYKALAYFELIRGYGDCVLIREEIEMTPQAKSSWTDVAGYAIDLAQSAVDLLPEFDQVTDYQGNPPRYKSTPCKGAANALLAHLCAWKAGGKYFAEDANYDDQALWIRAEQAASAVIESGTYSLAANPEEVVTSVLVGDSRESIYETVFKDLWYEQNESDRSRLFTMAPYYQTWPVMPNMPPSVVKDWAFRIYSTTVNQMFAGGDLRKHAYFYNFEEMSNPDNLSITGGFAYPYKWRKILVGTESWNAGEFINYNVNKIWWRLADIILLRAECRTRLSNEAGAIADLNTVRSRSNAALYDPAEYNGDVRYAVFKEREKELLMEGNRYYDVIRNGYAKTELEGGFRTASDQDFKDGAFFLIIAPNSGEFDNNPLMRQNKYWQKYL